MSDTPAMIDFLIDTLPRISSHVEALATFDELLEESFRRYREQTPGDREQYIESMKSQIDRLLTVNARLADDLTKAKQVIEEHF